MDLVRLFRYTVGRAPGAWAVSDGERRYTYAQLEEAVGRLAVALRRIEVGPHDRVAVLLKNRWETVVAFWAVQRVGAVFVPLNYHFSRASLRFCLQDAEPRAILYEESAVPDIKTLAEGLCTVLVALDDPAAHVGLSELLATGRQGAPFAEPDDEDLALMLYTSGTTGRPKGVPRSHRNTVAAAVAHVVHNRYRWRERTLGAMPLYHTMGVHLLVATAMVNGMWVAMPDFDADMAWQLINQERVSSLYLIPTMYYGLLKGSAGMAGTPPVRKLAYAGAPLSDELILECRERFDPEVFVNHYGSTEVYTHTVHDVLGPKPGSAGKAGIHSQIQVVAFEGGGEVPHALGTHDIGEIVVHGSSDEAFRGYWNRPDLTRQSLRNGWYHTGDLGYLDEEGDLFVVGRADELIISGGEHILPSEVERVLALHPNVAEVAVVGEPDPQWGKMVVAYVVPKRSGLSPQELDSFSKRQGELPLWARPRKYVFVRQIPRSSEGKVLRRALVNLEGTV